MSSAIEQLEWLSPTLSQQLQIIELANDPEIEPMKGLIIGTLADIAVSIRECYAT
jgi:hypothetical protein